MRQPALEEEYVRLTAPEHETVTHFSEHQEIEEVFENCNVPEFSGCDRLIKFETPFGMIQFGYYPAYKMSFLFASAKKSVYDSEISQQTQGGDDFHQFSETPGFNRNGLGKSSVFFRPPGFPWSMYSVEPLLRRTEALSKTIPFFSADRDILSRQRLIEESQKNQRYLMESYRTNQGDFSAIFRQRDNEFLVHQNYLNSLIVRKQSKSMNFFQKVNRIFDNQKQEIVEYYQTKFTGISIASQNSQTYSVGTGEGDDDDHEQDERIRDNQRA